MPPLFDACRRAGKFEGRKIFTGARGPSADINALAEMAARVSLVSLQSLRDIAELALNPVIVMRNDRPRATAGPERAV